MVEDYVTYSRSWGFEPKQVTLRSSHHFFRRRLGEILATLLGPGDGPAGRLTTHPHGCSAAPAIPAIPAAPAIPAVPAAQR